MFRITQEEAGPTAPSQATTPLAITGSPQQLTPTQQSQTEATQELQGQDPYAGPCDSEAPEDKQKDND